MSSLWSSLFGVGGEGGKDSGDNDESNGRWGSNRSNCAAASENDKKQVSPKSSSCCLCSEYHENDYATLTPDYDEDETIRAKRQELNAICERLRIEKEEIRHHRDVMNPTLVVRDDGYSVPFFSSLIASCAPAAGCEPNWQPEPLFCEENNTPKPDPSFPEPKIEEFGAPAAPENPCANYCNQFSKEEDSVYDPKPLDYEFCLEENFYQDQYCEKDPAFVTCDFVQELPQPEATGEDCHSRSDSDIVIVADEVEEILLEDVTGLEDLGADDNCAGPTEAEKVETKISPPPQAESSCWGRANKPTLADICPQYAREEDAKPLEPAQRCAPQQQPKVYQNLPKIENTCERRPVLQEPEPVPEPPKKECAPPPPPPKVENCCAGLTSCLDCTNLPKLEDICQDRKVPSSCDCKPEVAAPAPPVPECAPEPEPEPQPSTCDCSCSPPPAPVPAPCCPLVPIPDCPGLPEDVKEIVAKATQVAAPPPITQCAPEAAACQQCPRLIICYICDFGDTAAPQDPCAPKPAESIEVPKQANNCCAPPPEVPPPEVEKADPCECAPAATTLLLLVDECEEEEEEPVDEECFEEEPEPIIEECFEEPVVQEEPCPCPPIEVCDCSCGKSAAPEAPPEEEPCPKPEPQPEPEPCPPPEEEPCPKPEPQPEPEPCPPPVELPPCPVEPEPVPCRCAEFEPTPAPPEDDCWDEDPREPPPPLPPSVSTEERITELREHNSRFINQLCGCRKCVESGGCCEESDPGPYKCTCPDCGDVRGENPDCNMCSFTACMDRYAKICVEAETETECDCPDCVRDRCNSTTFDLNPDGTLKYEGGMCLQRAQVYMWKSTELKEPNSYSTLAYENQEFNGFSDCTSNFCTCKCTCGECEDCSDGGGGGSSSQGGDRCRGVDKKYHGAMPLDQVQKWFWCHGGHGR